MVESNNRLVVSLFQRNDVDMNQLGLVHEVCKLRGRPGSVQFEYATCEVIVVVDYLAKEGFGAPFEVQIYLMIIAFIPMENN